MNPWGAVRGQAAILGACLIALALMATPVAIVVVSLIAAVVLVAYASLGLSYTRSLHRSDARTPSAPRCEGDRWLAAEVLWVTLVPLVAYAIAVGTSAPRFPDLIEVATALIAVSIVLCVIFCSSMIDWFYVSPRIDGLVTAPPCCAGPRPRWVKLTKLWILHRLVAELTFVLVPAAGFVAILWELSSRTSGDLGVLIKAVGVAGTVFTLISRLSLPYIAAAGALLRTTPDFALGDTISWSVSPEPARTGVWRLLRRRSGGADRGRNLYILHVALNDVRVVPPVRHGQRKNVPRVETPDLLRRGSIVHCEREEPCARAGTCLQINERCERGEPDYEAR